MATLKFRIAFGIAALTVAGGAFAQAQVYRYTDADGRVVYSDRPPTADVKNLQTKKIGSNYISTSEPGYAAALAAERFPVTLYTFPCGEVCTNAEALLNKRGVPFTIVNVQDADGHTRLQAIAPEGVAPVLTVGDKQIAKGFNEAYWQAMLDDAGYPKTPPSRRAATGGRITDNTPPPPVAEGTKAVGAPPRGGDYPK